MQRGSQRLFYIWSLSWRQGAAPFIELGYSERKAFGTKDVETGRSGPDVMTARHVWKEKCRIY